MNVTKLCKIHAKWLNAGEAVVVVVVVKLVLRYGNGQRESFKVK